jgi:hypothetical protein
MFFLQFFASLLMKESNSKLLILKIFPKTRLKDPKVAILTLKNAYRKPPVIL